MESGHYNTPPSFNAGATTSNISKGCAKGRGALGNPEEHGHCSVSHLLRKVGLHSLVSLGIADGLHAPFQVVKEGLLQMHILAARIEMMRYKERGKNHQIKWQINMAHMPVDFNPYLSTMLCYIFLFNT